MIEPAFTPNDECYLIPRLIPWGHGLLTGHAARMEEGRNAFKILTGKHTGKGPVGRPRRRRENNIRIDIKEIGVIQRVGLIRLRIRITGYPL